nr:MAG: RNA-dependent RNA polymerase [Porcine picobirnavirus]
MANNSKEKEILKETDTAATNKKNGNSNTKSNNNNKNKSTSSNVNNNKGSSKGTGLATVTNDPAWWSQNPALLADAIAVSTDFTGTVINLKDPNRTDGPIHWFAAPGLLVYHLMPTFGINEGPGDPINLGTSQYYAFLRNRKRATKYDAPDLTCYTLAVGEIRSFITFLKRAYTIKNINEIENNYLYNELLEAMGLDANSWRNESYKFLSRWENLRLACEPFRYPDLAYYNLKDATYKYIYTETPGSIYDQMHIMVPAGFYQIDHDQDGATKLTFKTWDTGTPKTIDQAFDFVEEMIKAILNDQSFVHMSADILDSLTPAEIKPWNFLLDDMSKETVFVYDPIYLYRFKNTVVQSSTVIDTDVKQDPTKGFLISTPKVVIGSSEPNYFLQDYKLITTPEWNPNPLILTEFTMFTPAIAKTSEEGTYKVSSGFYFCSRVSVRTRNRLGESLVLNVTNNNKAKDGTLALIVALRPFKFCPRILFHLAGEKGAYDSTSKLFEYVDSDAICVMKNENLMSVHRGTMMNAFSVQLNNLQSNSRILSVPVNTTSKK